MISKYFLPSRSGEFLKLEYANIMSTPEKCKKFTELFLELPAFKKLDELSLPDSGQAATQQASCWVHELRIQAPKKELFLCDIVDQKVGVEVWNDTDDRSQAGDKGSSQEVLSDVSDSQYQV